MILFQVPIHSPWVSSPFSKMAETESVSTLAAGNMLVSMVRKVLSRCPSDDFRRLLSRGLAVGYIAAKLVCGSGVGGGVGSGGSESLARWWERPNRLPEPPASRVTPAPTSSPHPVQREYAAARPSGVWVDPSPSRRGDAGPGGRPRSQGPPCGCAPAGWLGQGVRCGGCAFSRLLLGRGRHGEGALSLQTL